jgi:hypothetical protein
MGFNQSSTSKEGRDDTPVKRETEPVNIKLSCADFGNFNGRSDHWITFKENTLSKAGVGGYAQFFKPNFIVNDTTKEGNQRNLLPIKECNKWRRSIPHYQAT